MTKMENETELEYIERMVREFEYGKLGYRDAKIHSILAEFLTVITDLIVRIKKIEQEQKIKSPIKVSKNFNNANV